MSEKPMKDRCDHARQVEVIDFGVPGVPPTLRAALPCAYPGCPDGFEGDHLSLFGAFDQDAYDRMATAQGWVLCRRSKART